MKTISTLSLIYILSLILNSCDGINQTTDNSNRVLILDGYVIPKAKVINGRIEVVTLKTVEGKGVEVVWDRSSIDSLGHFNLIVPPLPEDCLKPVNIFYKPSFGSISFSDTTAQIGRISFFPIYCKDSTAYGAEVWSDSVMLTHHISFLYSTKDVSIVGRDSSFSGPQDIYVSEYNVVMKKGWNRLVHTYLPAPVPEELHYSIFVDNQINGYWLVPNY